MYSKEDMKNKGNLTIEQLNDAYKKIKLLGLDKNPVAFLGGVPVYESNEVPYGVLWCKKYNGLFKKVDISKYLKKKL